MIDFRQIPKRTNELLSLCENNLYLSRDEILKDRTGLSKRGYRYVTLIRAAIYHRLLDEYGYMFSPHILKAMDATKHQEHYYKRMVYDDDYNKIFDIVKNI